MAHNQILKSYSFLDTNISIVGPGGAFTLGLGAASGGITIAMRSPKDKLDIGADGSGMHSLIADKSATVNIPFLKTSPDNSKLNLMYNLQSQSATLWGQNVITITSSNGDAVVLNGGAFSKQPDLVYGQEGGELHWVMEFVSVDEILAGALI